MCFYLDFGWKKIMEELTIDTNVVMVSLDVMALYTNIPHNEARNVMHKILDARTDRDTPTHFLLDLLNLILEKKLF